MKWYAEQSLGTKIIAGFLLVACVSGLSGILAAGSIWEVGRRGELLYTGNLLPVSDLAEVAKGYESSLASMRDVVIDQSPQEQSDHLEKLKRSEEAVSKGLARFFASNRSPEALALHKSIDEDLKLYDFFRQKIVELATGGRRDEAVNIMRTQAADVTDRLDLSIAKLVGLNKDQAHKRYLENMSATRHALAISALFLSLGVLAALLTGYFLYRGISAPVKTIADKLAAITGGDLTVRVGGYPAGNCRNELHVLARNVDGMAATLHEVVAGIARESVRLSGASGRLNGASGEMAQRVEVSSGEIRSVAGASSEMSLTASEIAGNCTTAADNLNFASEAAGKGAKNMEETIVSVREIGEHARSTSQVVSRLAARSLQISDITETIDDIADQTNLLALNAAIEAARAGDYGRGFAVVADEVRALASRTTTATKEISAMIEAMQSETGLAIAAMEKGVAAAAQGVAKAESTGGWLEAISASICSISQEVTRIATAAEEQSCTVGAISGNLQKVTEVAKESAAGTQQFVAAALEMHQMSEELRRMVSGFKIEEGGDEPQRQLPDQPMEESLLQDLAFAPAC